jgi:outer membrane protein OmpA-like peptidoglycan-associated protein
MNALARLAAVVAIPLAMLAGCATSPPPAPASTTPPAVVVPVPHPAVPPPVTPPAAPPSPLEGEVRWMRQLFDGTPVTIESESDGAMRVEVPMQYAFDSEQSVLKPPMAAVLDKVALSLKRNPTARVHLASPGKTTAAARSAAMREHLRTRGVAPARIATVAAQREEVVAVRVLPGYAPIDRLDDSKLPPPPAPAVTR